jgi:two-component system phosphate regulon sensor histidine kinase PhoR
VGRSTIAVALRRFVANVSHELRTPLAAIAGAAETLSEGALHDPEAGPKFLDTITRHADRLKALVDDLLTLSRLESSPESIDRVPVDFAHVVRQSCDAVAGRARDAGLALEVHADFAVRVLGDPEALRRLVDNLVVNAVTYTPSGGWVKVSLAAEGGRAVLTVADSGIGIPPEHIERIFERFFRVDKARSRAKGGTGLGLAIVKHAVNLHGGQVAVDSRPGAGSTFTVSIPVSKDGDHPSDAA